MPYILRIVLRPPHRPETDAVQLPRRIDYTSQIRIFLNYREGDLEGHEPEAARAFIYADTRTGGAPIEAGRLYAKEPA